MNHVKSPQPEFLCNGIGRGGVTTCRASVPAWEPPGSPLQNCPESISLPFVGAASGQSTKAKADLGQALDGVRREGTVAALRVRANAPGAGGVPEAGCRRGDPELTMFGNAAHGLRLPYNYLSRREWTTARKANRLRPEAMKERLGLCPILLSWLFDPRLHFIARLKPAS